MVQWLFTELRDEHEHPTATEYVDTYKERVWKGSVAHLSAAA